MGEIWEFPGRLQCAGVWGVLLELVRGAPPTLDPSPQRGRVTTVMFVVVP